MRLITVEPNVRKYYCDECKLPFTTGVQMGEAPDYYSSTAELCLPCLKRAVRLIELSDTP